MNQRGRLIHNRSRDIFSDLTVNIDLLCEIVDDMVANAGDLAPGLQWRKGEHVQGVKSSEIKKRYREVYLNDFNKMGDSLDAWVGCTGMQPLDKAWLKKCKPFINQIDALGLLDALENTKTGHWLNTDIGTIQELNILNLFTPNTDEGIDTFFLELGGGYGRLCEGMFSVFNDIRYVLIDAVPGSLMYSYQYLTTQFPDLKIGYYYNGDSFNMESYDIYIMPAWHFKQLNNLKYDCTINVSSMQEMEQHHIDYYLKLFDDVTRPGGVVYSQNARDYVFKGNWAFPDNWERAFLFNTPLSWTLDYPSELFIKHTAAEEYDFDEKNKLFCAGYQHQLSLLKDQEKLITKSEKQCNSLSTENSSLYQRISSYCEENDLLRQQISGFVESQSKYEAQIIEKDSTINNYKAKNEQIEEKCKQCEETLNNVYSSRSYKIGRRITSPLRLVKKVANKTNTK